MQLNKIRERVQNKNHNITLADEQFLLAKELGCLGEIIGREYELIKKDGEIVGFRQKPMDIATYINLIEAFKKYKEMEEREMKKARRKGKR